MPAGWSWQDLRRDLVVRQDLAPSTAAATVRLLRYLEREGLQIRPPDPDLYLDWMAHARLRNVGGPIARRNWYQAVLRLVRFLQLEKSSAWRDVLTPPRRTPRAQVVLAPDDVVARLCSGNFPRDNFSPYLQRALPHFFRLGFYLAVRPPTELVGLQLRGWDPGSQRLRVFAPKTRTWRTLQLEPWLAQDLGAYLQLRATVARSSTAELLVDGRGGPWTNDRLRMTLCRAAWQIWPRFHLYAMRHWGLTARMRSWRNIYLVQRWAGHHQLSTTQVYVHLADHELAQLRAPAFRPVRAAP